MCLGRRFLAFYTSIALSVSLLPFLVLSLLPDHLPLLGDSVSFASGLIHKSGKEWGEESLGFSPSQWPGGRVRRQCRGTGAELMGSKKIQAPRCEGVLWVGQ